MPQITLEEYEQIVPNVEVDGIIFITPNKHCYWRAETFYTKEPDTIAWIRSMPAGSVLYDVGANIAQYSMFAAKHGVKVHGFEPEAQNFALACRNVAINRVSDLVTMWPMALSDHSSFDILHLSTILAGGSCHSYGESKDFHGHEKQFPHSQGSIALTMDEFARKYGPPDYIKIDVDGFEHLVLKGASICLNRAKSVLVELNRNYPEHLEVIDMMHNLGFSYDPAVANEAMRKDGPFKDVGNIIFNRVTG